jgi:hypothetical protein
MATKKTKVNYTLASAAKANGYDPKVVRAKFRRLKAEAPFDHTKVKGPLSAKQVSEMKAFLETDYRKNA